MPTDARAPAPGRSFDLALGVAALAAAAALWGANHVAARSIRGEVVLSALIFWRWVIALVVLLPFAWPRLRAEAALLRRHARWIAAMGAVGVGMFSWLIHAAAYSAPATDVALLGAMTPIWALLIAALLRIERIGPLQVAGAGCAVFGAALILMQGRWHGAVSAIGIGHVWALLASIVFAGYSVLLGRRPQGLSVTSFTGTTAFAGTALVAAPLYLADLVGGEGPFFARTATLAPLHSLTVVFFMAIGPTLIANLLWAHGAKRVQPAAAASMTCVTPLAASLLSVALLGESIHAYHLEGLAAICAGIALTTRGSSRRAALDRSAAAAALPATPPARHIPAHGPIERSR